MKKRLLLVLSVFLLSLGVFSCSTKDEVGDELASDNGTSESNLPFVVVGDSGVILTSPDGENWTKISSNTNSNLNKISFGNSKYVFVGDSGEVNYSNNGSIWSSLNYSTVNSYSIVDFSNGYFWVALSGDDRGLSLNSTDGISWSKSTVVQSSEWFRGISGNNNIYVSIWTRGPINYSYDLVSWNTGHNVMLDNNDIIYGENKFIVIGSIGKLLSSIDGVNWISQNSGTSKDLYEIEFNGTIFIIVGDSGVILSSPDGVNWTSQTSGVSTNLSGVTYGGGKFVVVGDSGTILTSPDGMTWIPQTSGVSTNLNGITHP